MALGGVVAARHRPKVGPARPGSWPRGRAAVGAGVAVVAGLLLLDGFAVAAWYDTTDRDLPEHFGFDMFGSYVHDEPAVIVQAYFPGLAYALAVAAVGGALVSAWRGVTAPLGRTIAVAAGMLGAVVTPWALSTLLAGPHPPFDGLWDHPSAGPFLVVAGYLLAAVAALLPPPVRTRAPDTIGV